MSDVLFNFEDNRVEIKRQLESAVGKFLVESSALLVSQVAQNTKVDTGQLKGSWAANIDEQKGIATIGSPLENAIWEEFGTGEYALKDNGRKGGWFYEDAEGNGHFTHGKKPRRMLHKAFNSKKSGIIRRAEQILRGELG